MKEKRYEAAYAGFVYEAPATHWTPSTVVRQRLTKMDFTKPDGIELGECPLSPMDKQHLLMLQMVIPLFLPVVV